ncbi:MAG: exo-alpha-sialidase [Acidobacteria bacterium]|nr:exo-alpha-sialidase [Acidobacteriota bacterium]
MKSHWTKKLLVVSLFLGLAACPRQSRSGGLDGNEVSGAFGQPPLPPSLIAPNGQRIKSNSRDALGYVLPLDVLRPKTPRPEGPAPLILPTAYLGFGPFVEERLGLDDGHTQNETAIDANGDIVIAGWNQAKTGGIDMGVARSTNAGGNWTWTQFSGHNVMSDPVVASGGNGKWYYAYLGTDLSGSDVEIYALHSDDDGATWSAPVRVTQNTTIDDKPYMAAQGDTVLIAWADFSFSPAKVAAAVSLNGGSSFIRHTVLADNSPGGNGASPVIGPDGRLYVFWRDSFQQFLWVADSQNEGQTWSTDRQVTAMMPLPSMFPPGFRIVNLPSAAINPQNQTLCVIWNDQAMGDPDILSVSSSDGGFTWTKPVRVNDDISGQPQFFPWIDVDSEGTFHAIWYDMRGNGSDIDVYYANSQDDGATWSSNERITPAAFTPILPWESGLASFIGDYNGLAVTDQKVFAFYQDSRRGEQDVYVAVKNRQPVFTYPEVLALWPDPVNILTILPLLP